MLLFSILNFSILCTLLTLPLWLQNSSSVPNACRKRWLLGFGASANSLTNWLCLCSESITGYPTRINKIPVKMPVALLVYWISEMDMDLRPQSQNRTHGLPTSFHIYFLNGCHMGSSVLSPYFISSFLFLRIAAWSVWTSPTSLCLSEKW